MTVAQALAAGRARLRKAADNLPALGDSIRADAQRLFGEAAGRDSGWLLAHADAPVDAGAYRRYEGLIERRSAGVPLAYVLGRAGFYGREFIVDERVLVPRPETEHLVEAALADLRGRKRGTGRIADIGTGSGAIAVTLACELAGARIVGTDASAPALAVANQNARRLGVAARCRFIAGDLAAPLAAAGPFDCIVANLPYVPTGAVPQVPNPVGYEPRLAVDGGRDGLDLYRRLLAQLPALLAAGAGCFFEAAPPTIELLAELCERAFPAALVAVGEDYAGLERFVAITG